MQLFASQGGRALAALLLSACAGALAACSSTPEPGRIDPALLDDVPSARKAPVELARNEARVAADARDNAERQTVIARDAVDLAYSELDGAIARVDSARVALTTADRAGTPESKAGTRAEYEKELRRTAAARCKLALAKRELEVSALRQLVATEEAKLAKARVDLAIGTAAEGPELPASQSVALQDLRADVRYHEDEVATANRRLEAARVEVQKARNAYDEALEAAEK